MNSTKIKCYITFTNKKEVRIVNTNVFSPFLFLVECIYRLCSDCLMYDNKFYVYFEANNQEIMEINYRLDLTDEFDQSGIKNTFT